MTSAVLELGLAPKALRLHLPTGSDFTAVLTCKDEDGAVTDWPVGTVWSLVFSDSAASVWTATTSGSTATFEVDKATADTMPDGTVVKLRYVNGTTDRIYYVGKVVRHG